MIFKVWVRAWLSEREILPNGVRSRYTRGQTIVGQMLCLLALALLIGASALVFVIVLGNSRHASLGGLVAHGVKLGILGLL